MGARSLRAGGEEERPSPPRPARVLSEKSQGGRGRRAVHRWLQHTGPSPRLGEPPRVIDHALPVELVHTFGMTLGIGQHTRGVYHVHGGITAATIDQQKEVTPL